MRAQALRRQLFGAGCCSGEVGDGLLVFGVGEVHGAPQCLGTRGKPSTEQCDQVALHLVDPAAEGEDEAALEGPLEAAAQRRAGRSPRR